MKNFRSLITDRIENLLIWGGDAPISVSTDNINKGLLKQDINSQRGNYAMMPDAVATAVAPNAGYFTPLYRVYRSPLRVEAIASNDDIPACFIYMLEGMRPADVEVVLGNTAETVIIGIDIIFRNQYGALTDPSNVFDMETNPAKPLTDQVNGILTDLDILLNPQNILDIDFETLADTDTDQEYIDMLPLISLYDAGIIEWRAGLPDDERIPSEFEVVRVVFGVIVTFPINLVRR